MPTVVSATGGFNVARYTQKILPGLVEKKHRDLPFAAGQVVPFRNDIGLETTEIVEHFFEGAGSAQFLSEIGNDIPFVSGSIGEDSYKVRIPVNGYRLTYPEMARINMSMSKMGAGTIQNKLANNAQRSISELVNDYIAFGDADLGLTGFFNNPDVPAVADVTALYAAATDFQLHVDFINDVIISPFRQQTRLNNGPFMLYVPDTLLGVWTNTYGNDGTTSVMKAIMENNRSRGLVGIESLNECAKDGQSGSLPAAIGTANNDRIVCVRMDPDVMAYDGSSISQWPTVPFATGIIVPLWQVVGQCIISIANCIRYIDVVRP